MIDPRLRARGGERDVSSPAIRREERSEIPASDSKARTKSGASIAVLHSGANGLCAPTRAKVPHSGTDKYNGIVSASPRARDAAHTAKVTSPRAICRTKCTLAAVQAVRARARARGRSEMRA